MSPRTHQARAAKAIQALAEDVPSRVLEDWATQLPEQPPTRETMGRYLIPWAASARPRVQAFLNQWASEFPTVTGSAVALAISTHLLQQPRRIEITWSGPVPTGSTVRRTEQALLEMVETAERSLWIITYSAYDVSDVKTAIQAAVNRGVDVRFLLETQEDGSLKGDPSKALGLEEGATVFVWPKDQRPQVRKQQGVLHAKAVIKDDSEVLITSANLTGNAMHLNVELGCRIAEPGTVSWVLNHLDRLISSEVFQSLGGATATP